MKDLTAYDIVKMLRDYWRDRGYTITAEVVPCYVPSKSGKDVLSINEVKSNLVNGLPPGYRKDGML